MKEAVLRSIIILMESEFTKIFGFERQRELFRRAIKKGRLAHAYAFVGPEKAGKQEFALSLAKELGADLILDVIMPNPEAGLSVETARGLLSRLMLTPAGRMKVAIFPRAHEFTPAVGNLLLKVLEEPPPHSLLILLTNNYYSLLPTVASRVQRVFFSRKGSDEDDRSSKLAEYVEILYDKDVIKQLRAAEAVAKLEEAELKIFLVSAMKDWAARPGSNPGLGRRLMNSWGSIRSNLNQKVVMDNLYLS